MVDLTDGRKLICILPVFLRSFFKCRRFILLFPVTSVFLINFFLHCCQGKGMGKAEKGKILPALRQIAKVRTHTHTHIRTQNQYQEKEVRNHVQSQQELTFHNLDESSHSESSHRNLNCTLYPGVVNLQRKYYVGVGMLDCK